MAIKKNAISATKKTKTTASKPSSSRSSTRGGTPSDEPATTEIPPVDPTSLRVILNVPAENLVIDESDPSIILIGDDLGVPDIGRFGMDSINYRQATSQELNAAGFLDHAIWLAIKHPLGWQLISTLPNSLNLSSL